MSKVLAELPADEWDGWRAYTATHPVGPRQADFRAAVVAAALGGGGGVMDLFPSLAPPPDRGGVGFRRWALATAPAAAASGH